VSPPPQRVRRGRKPHGTYRPNVRTFSPPPFPKSPQASNWEQPGARTLCRGAQKSPSPPLLLPTELLLPCLFLFLLTLRGSPGVKPCKKLCLPMLSSKFRIFQSLEPPRGTQATVPLSVRGSTYWVRSGFWLKCSRALPTGMGGKVFWPLPCVLFSLQITAFPCQFAKGTTETNRNFVGSTTSATHFACLGSTPTVAHREPFGADTPHSLSAPCMPPRSSA